MTLARKFLIVFELLLLVMQTSISRAQDVGPSLELTLASDKEAYKIGDEVKFILRFKNMTDADWYFYADPYYNAKLFTVKDQSGVEQSWEMMVVYDIAWEKESYKLIKADETFEWIIKARFSRDDGVLYLDFGDSRIGLSGTGSYSVVVQCKGWDGFSMDKDGRRMPLSEKLGLKNVFLGSLKSNTIIVLINKAGIR